MSRTEEQFAEWARRARAASAPAVDVRNAVLAAVLQLPAGGVWPAASSRRSAGERWFAPGVAAALALLAAGVALLVFRETGAPWEMAVAQWCDPPL